MNGKLAKKIRRATAKDIQARFGEIAEVIDSAPLKIRVKIMWKILWKKL